MYIDDCVKGTQMIVDSDVVELLNPGSNELVTINQLVEIVQDIAGIKLKRRYDLKAPKGVNGRNSDKIRLLSNALGGHRGSACVTAWKRPIVGFTIGSSGPRASHRQVTGTSPLG